MPQELFRPLLLLVSFTLCVEAQIIIGPPAASIPATNGTGLPTKFYSFGAVCPCSIGNADALAAAMSPTATFTTLTPQFPQSGYALSPLSLQAFVGSNGASFSSDFASTDDGYFIMSGYLAIRSAGTVNFDLSSDDGSELSVGGQVLMTTGGQAHNTAAASFTQPGLYPITLKYFQNGGYLGIHLAADFRGEINFATISTSDLYDSSTPSGTVNVSSSALTFSYQKGTAGPIPPQLVTITTDGPSIAYSISTVSSTPLPWFTIAPLTGSTPTTLIISVATPTTLSPGSYTGTVIITTPQAVNKAQSVRLTLSVIAGQSSVADRRLVVVLFSGFALPGDTNTGDGLKTLSSEITSTPELTGVVAKVFGHDKYNDAIGFIASNLRGPDDQLSLIGHSFGGDTARLMAQALSKGFFVTSHTRLHVDSLIVIDPINPDLFIEHAIPLLDQSHIVEPRPDGVGIVEGFFQRLFGQVLQGYRIAKADLEYQYDVPHSDLDNDSRVHREILTLLKTFYQR